MIELRPMMRLVLQPTLRTVRALASALKFDHRTIDVKYRYHAFELKRCVFIAENSFRDTSFATTQYEQQTV